MVQQLGQTPQFSLERPAPPCHFPHRSTKLQLALGHVCPVHQPRAHLCAIKTPSQNVSLGNAFVGVEGEYSTSDGTTDFPNTIAGARDGLDANGQYYLGVRAGVALTPGIAAYGKVGYTSLDTTAFTSSGSLSDLEDNTSGIRFGGGVQVQLPGPLEARLEYRRSQYGDVGAGEFGNATTDQVVAGVGLRF